MTKSVIGTLQDHRTRRQFTTEPISDAQFAQIITTAQQMPTSQYLHWLFKLTSLATNPVTLALTLAGLLFAFPLRMKYTKSRR